MKINRNYNLSGKLLALLLVGLFVISSFSVLADNDTNDDDTNDTPKEIKERIDDMSSKAQANRAKARARIRDATQRVEATRERYIEAKQKYAFAKQRVEQHRGELVDLRDRVRDCDGEDCLKNKFNLRKGVHQHLIKTFDVMENSLEKLNNRVSSSEVLSDNEKEEALFEISELEDQLIVQKQRIEELGEEATAEELKVAIKDLKKTWKEVRMQQKKIISFLINSRLDNAVEKHQEFLNGMDLRIEELKSADVDVTNLEKMREEFARHVEKIESAHQEVTDAWSETDKENWQEKQEVLREELKASKDFLREFLTEYRNLKQTVTQEQ